MKKINFCIITFAFFMFNSCFKQQTISEKIEGSWMIEEIYYSNNNIKDSLKYNMLFFKNKEERLFVKLPEVMEYEAQSSTWKINKNNNLQEKLTLNSNDFIEFSSFVKLKEKFIEIYIELIKFQNISRYSGERFDLVQAGGGNSSVKIDDWMFIKASGYNMTNVCLLYTSPSPRDS